MPLFRWTAFPETKHTTLQLPIARRSRIISPQGELLKEAISDQDEVIDATIDFTAVAKQKHDLPYLGIAEQVADNS
ncbi:hypothetical protein HUG15_07845 [Salicibibacter cibarius]|uniref:CN hydrolase domain-containing protein n=1 Tax=Salicibibacter cibarius TaxID=2743000 RepID=A0A7T6Z2C5_9BACI|nr:hypothetical protein [Salicibibacter cibarius]QQK75503.1 hypothetical protein HUG15_07845 [Salicibibacter cibarius]